MRLDAPLSAPSLALLVLSVAWSPARAQVLAGELLYNSIQPCRVLDTRLAAGGALAAGETRAFHVVGDTGFEPQGGRAGGCGIPGFAAGEPQAQAVMLNFVAVGPAGPGHLTAYATDAATVPTASVINYSPAAETGGLNIANAIALPVRQDTQGGDLTIQAFVSATHVVADAVGFFTVARPRRYYLTPATHAGSTALNACAEGFHMASLWEIFDPSSLEYDTALGQASADSGDGPPTSGSLWGWVRTGTIASNSTTAGVGNCNAWTSSLSTDSGTRVILHTNWLTAPISISPWLADDDSCLGGERVWCVED